MSIKPKGCLMLACLLDAKDGFQLGRVVPHSTRSSCGKLGVRMVGRSGVVKSYYIVTSTWRDGIYKRCFGLNLPSTSW